MPKIQSAVQSRAISELMCQSKQVEFMDFDRVDHALAALADQGGSVIDMIVINLKQARADVDKLRTASIRNRLEYVHEQTIVNLKELYSLIQDLDYVVPDTDWPDSLIHSLRAMLVSVDCTTAEGQAEMRGMVRVLSELGLVGQPDSSIGEVA